MELYMSGSTEDRTPTGMMYEVVDFPCVVCMVGVKSSWQVHHLATKTMAASLCIKRN